MSVGHPQTKGSEAGRWYLGFIGFSLAALGALFVGLMLFSYWKSGLTRHWQETQAVVIISKIAEENSARTVGLKYCWQVEYVYEFDGQSYSSRRYKQRTGKWTEDRKQAEAARAKYPRDAKVLCYVNPENPKQAVLEHETQAAGYTIWFPGLFLIGGLVIMWRAIFGQKI